MLKFFHRFCLSLLLATCVSGVQAAPLPTQQSQSRLKAATRASALEKHKQLKQFVHIPNFRLGGHYAYGEPEKYEYGGSGGTTLESLNQSPLQVAYIATGTPRRNAQGQIINAVVVNSYYSGDASLLYHFWYAGQAGNDFAQGAIIGPGQLIDTHKYYVIFLDAVGLWGTSKPSSGLGPDFPEYSIVDMVQANYRLLKDHLNVAHVKLAMGPSMGGMQSYVWSVLHPDYVDAILPIGASAVTQTDPIVRDLFQLMSAAIVSDPSWRKTRGRYYHLPKNQHPNEGVEFGWSILAHTGISLDLQYQQGWQEKQKNTFVWGPDPYGEKLHAKSRDYDANDLLYRNKALFSFDILDQLKRIQAKTLIVHIQNDQWLHPDNARKAKASIPQAQLYTFSDPLAHYAIFKAPNQFKSEIAEFIQSLP